MKSGHIKLPGRKKTRVQMSAACIICRKKFQWWAGPNTKARTCCGNACTVAAMRQARCNRIPGPEELRYLYVNLKQPTTAIARQFGASPRGVNQALQRAGIPRRTKNNGTFHCQIPGCGEFAKKIHHAGNGAEYGTLCARHYEEHRAELAARYAREQQAKGLVKSNNRWVRPEEAEYTKVVSRFVKRASKPVSKERTLPVSEVRDLFGLEESS